MLALATTYSAVFLVVMFVVMIVSVYLFVATLVGLVAMVVSALLRIPAVVARQVRHQRPKL